MCARAHNLLRPLNRPWPYAYDVTEGRPAALGVKRNTATCVIAKHAARGANPASHTAGLARPGPRTERLSANAHCQHNTCALRDTRLASLLWRCDPLWRQCIRSIKWKSWIRPCEVFFLCLPYYFPLHRSKSSHLSNFYVHRIGLTINNSMLQLAKPSHASKQRLIWRTKTQ